jgi:hypothetical protein
MSGKVLAFPKRAKGKRKPVELVGVEAVERARAMLSQAKDLREVADMRDKAAAMAHYARARAAGKDAHADAWEIVQLATRRLGELTAVMPKAKSGPARAGVVSRDATKPKGASTAELGLTRQQVSRAEKLAALPEREFRDRVAAGRARITKQAEPDSMLSTSASSGYDGDEYCTPEVYVVAARTVLDGRIELDPASNAFAQNVVRADRFYTKHDSGLEVPWGARTLWLNPPYSRRLISEFAAKLVAERHAKHFDAGIALTNCDPSTAWWQALAKLSDAMCSPDHRIGFELAGKRIPQNLYAQTFFYYGPRVRAFFDAFSPFGLVSVPLREHK